MKYKILIGTKSLISKGKLYLFLCLSDGTKIPRQTRIEIIETVTSIEAIVSVVLVNDPKNEVQFVGGRLFLRELELIGAQVLSYKPVKGKGSDFQLGEIVFKVTNCEVSTQKYKELQYLI